MTENQHLPSRKDRLRTFIKLKQQRRYLGGAAGVLLAASAVLGAMHLSPQPADARVPLGTGIAGVKGQNAGSGPQAIYEPRNSSGRGRESPMADGQASYYGNEFAGQRTASGETFNPKGLTAAHRTLPFGSRVRVTNGRTGKSVVVRINDRGPFHRARVIDLSHAAAERIGLLSAGRAKVRLALLQN